MRGRKNVPEFVDLIVAKNDVLIFLLTSKDGENFNHLVDKLKIASEKMYNSERIQSCCHLIYSHAFKYRHFAFIEYFLQIFNKNWNIGLEVLFNSKLKHTDFLRIFLKFQSVYEAENKERFQKTCANGCVLILKNYNWAFFQHFITLWQDRPFEKFITLAGYAIKKNVHFDKFIRLLHECCKSSNVWFVRYYTNELTCVASKECTEKFYFYHRYSYAEILFMYGAHKYSVVAGQSLVSYDIRRKRCEEKMESNANLLSLFYCFHKKSLCFIF